MDLDLARATIIVDAAIAKARETSTKPQAVAVVDTGGHVIVVKREDNAGFLYVDMAIGKAWASVSMRRPAGVTGERLMERPGVMSVIGQISGGRFMPAGGGVLIRDAEGRLLGAVGVAGDVAPKDEVCAIAGIEAAGLKAEAR